MTLVPLSSACCAFMLVPSRLASISYTCGKEGRQQGQVVEPALE